MGLNGVPKEGTRGDKDGAERVVETTLGSNQGSQGFLAFPYNSEPTNYIYEVPMRGGRAVTT